MKKFITSLIYFSTFLLLILFSLIFIANIGLKNEILNDLLESKIEALKIDTTQTNIIIAGDSRAEVQLIPKTFKERTGINTINIAVPACDLVSTVSEIKKNYSSQNNIFIISASSWQINDGIVNTDMEFSSKSFLECTIGDLFVLYKSHPTEFFNKEIQLIKNYFKKLLFIKSEITINENILKNHGFNGVENNLVKDKDFLVNTITSHFWYKDLNYNGVRWRLFQKALSEIGSMNASFIIYQPPASPYWKTPTLNTFIDRAEIEYAEKVELEVKKYKNILFIDFYQNDIPGLNDSAYSDYQHLNRQGAVKFTNHLIKILEDKKLLSPKPL